MLVEGVVAMTRTRIVGAGVAGLMVLSMLVPAAASAGDVRYRHYRGQTSQGGLVSAKTYVKDATRDGIIDFSSVTLDCEDGSQFQLGVAFDLPMPPGETFGLDHLYPFAAVHVHGRLGVHGGSGTLSLAIPTLNADEQAQLCSSGELTWQVERTDAGSASLPSADVQMQVTSRADGTTRTVFTSDDGTTRTVITRADGTTRSFVTPEEGTAPTSVRLRNYRGRTSQVLPMFVVTAKVDSTIQLRKLYVVETLGCEDGTELRWLFFGHGPTLPPARLDFDYVSTQEVFRQEAFHIRGRLGTHVGSGTASDAIPTLNADEQAQLCTTGDLTWRLWRTDAGARIIVP